MSVVVAAVLLATVAAPAWNLQRGATLVEDGGRPSARVYYVDIYTPEPQPQISTRDFKGILADHPGEVLEVCARSRASVLGRLVLSIPRAVGDMVTIATPAGGHYRTRCAPFTVRAHPLSRPGFVQVANESADYQPGRVDLIRKVFIREPA